MLNEDLSDYYNQDSQKSLKPPTKYNR